MKNFFPDYFFTNDYFYRRLIFTDKYSYILFTNENINLKIPLVYLFDFKFD